MQKRDPRDLPRLFRMWRFTGLGIGPPHPIPPLLSGRLNYGLPSGQYVLVNISPGPIPEWVTGRAMSYIPAEQLLRESALVSTPAHHLDRTEWRDLVAALEELLVLDPWWQERVGGYDVDLEGGPRGFRRQTLRIPYYSSLTERWDDYDLRVYSGHVRRQVDPGMLYERSKWPLRTPIPPTLERWILRQDLLNRPGGSKKARDPLSTHRGPRNSRSQGLSARPQNAHSGEMIDKS